jgi:hypothetical protein
MSHIIYEEGKRDVYTERDRKDAHGNGHQHGVYSMTMHSIDEFDSLAAKVLNLIDQSLLDQGIVETIIDIYTKFCSSDEAQRLSIVQAKLSDETRLRLRFECMAERSGSHLQPRHLRLKSLGQTFISSAQGWSFD